MRSLILLSDAIAVCPSVRGRVKEMSVRLVRAAETFCTIMSMLISASASVEKIGFESLLYDDSIGKVSLIGAGMRSHPGVTATFFGALAEAGVNIEMISTSEIRISVVVDQKDVDEAVNATHKAFDLDAGEVEAVVYGGTGR